MRNTARIGWLVLVGGLAAALAVTGCEAGGSAEPPDSTTADSSSSDTMSLDSANSDPNGSQDGNSQDSDPIGADSLDPGASPSPQAVVAAHEALAKTLKTHVDGPEWFHDGHWQQHYGDAYLYGPAYDAAFADRTGSAASLDRAVLALTRNRELVTTAANDLAYLLDHTESAAMALLGLLEAGRVFEEPLYLVEAEALMGLIDSVSKGADDYLDLTVGGFASSTYGPTSLTAFVLLAHAGFAHAVPESSEAHRARFEEILAAVDARAWDAERRRYRFQPDDDRLFLYPNVLMMLAIGRAHGAWPRPDWAERISEIRDAISPLRDAQGYYRSPYSAEVMGAQTDDYATLSATNYLMLASWYAFMATRDRKFLAIIDESLRFCSTHLLQNGRLLHHWMDGRIAQPTDPSYYCTGCNLQTLVVWELMQVAN